MNAAKLGVFSVALSFATASGQLGAADLVVTVSPNPVTVNTSATILAAAFVPGCLDATFDFGDGTKASGEFVVKSFVATQGDSIGAVKCSALPVTAKITVQ